MNLEQTRTLCRTALLKLLPPLLRRWAKKGLELYLKLTVKVRVKIRL